MSTTPSGMRPVRHMRRVSLRAALALGAACTAAAFGAGFTLAADDEGPAESPHGAGAVERDGSGYRDGAGPDWLPAVCKGASAAMGDYNVLREDAISLGCQYLRDGKGDVGTVVRELRRAAKNLEGAPR
ncbi:hypothetical protein [Streptomyces sp. NPDC059009]|uniref:hypothetical protein n=1 Tax=Streptomyces sp. NPDC059009 TaxID=3346694 RepID=UPI0036884E4A